MASRILSAVSSGSILDVVNVDKFSLQMKTSCLCCLHTSAENFDPKAPEGVVDCFSISFGRFARLVQIGPLL